MPQEWKRGAFTISDDPARLDLPLIHQFISTQSYWGVGRPIEVVKKSIDGSVPFGVYKGDEMVGFARVVTDGATFGWIADVFVQPSERGQGLSKWLMEVMLDHPDLQGFRRWVLATKDAQGLYRKFGFEELKRPERWMERFDPNMQEAPDYWKQD
ncbi:MAG: GNAT family N-acetyltransferase [Pyrinomonadaceae bacterium]